MDTTRLDIHGLDPLTLRWVRVTRSKVLTITQPYG